MHVLRHHPPSTNGAPQVIAVVFAAVIWFMLVLPFAEYSSGGTTTPEILVHLVKGDPGFNIFSLALLIAPLVGIAVVVLARTTWRAATFLVAIVAFLLVPISVLTLNREMHATTNGTSAILPGVGSYLLAFCYGGLVVVMGILAFRARKT